MGVLLSQHNFMIDFRILYFIFELFLGKYRMYNGCNIGILRAFKGFWPLGIRYRSKITKMMILYVVLIF